jgi:hypothetical protein
MGASSRGFGRRKRSIMKLEKSKKLPRLEACSKV